MKPSNARMQLVFDFELSVPDELAALDPSALKVRLGEILGAMVVQGLPTIAGKQLAKSGVTIVGQTHQIAAAGMVASNIDRAELIAAAPHLTDDELARLAQRAGTKLAGGAEDRLRALRRHALAIANEFRLVPCVVHVVLTSEQPGELSATLNLTNGSIMVEGQDRQKRLLPGQHGVSIEIPAAGVKLPGTYAGHTISGPVIEVAVADIAKHRDVLIGAWQAGT